MTTAGEQKEKPPNPLLPSNVEAKRLEDLRLKTKERPISEMDAAKAILECFEEWAKQNDLFKAQVQLLKKESLVRLSAEENGGGKWEFLFGSWYVNLRAKHFEGRVGAAKAAIGYRGVLYHSAKKWKAEIMVGGVH